MKEYLDMWEKAFDFKGRTNRKDFWIAYGINLGIMIVLGMLFMITSLSDAMVTILIFPSTLAFIYSLMTIIPLISMQIRRLHDTGHSAGFYVLITLLSFCYIGAIIRLIFYVIPGDKNENKWGVAPEEKPVTIGSLPENTETINDTSPSANHEGEFVDRYITESQLPKKKRWLRNMLILFGISTVIFILLFMLLFLLY
ncbi:MAG: DUF805 domain-containing protein [Lachnospiraceae bacterium]